MERSQTTGDWKEILLALTCKWSWKAVTCYIVYILSILTVFVALGWICNLERHSLDFPGLISSKINIFAGISVFCGLFTLTVIRILSSSKTSLYGILFIIAGLFTTIYVTTMIHFIASFGVIETHHREDEKIHILEFPNTVTAFALALYGIGACLFRDVQIIFQENFTISDSTFIFIMIIGNIIAALTYLQPVIVSIKDIFDVGEHLSLEKGEFNKTGDKSSQPLVSKYTSQKTCGVVLLTNLKLIIILLGLSIVLFVEFAYQWMLPYFLMQKDFSIHQTVTFLSVCVNVEIWFRLLAPYVASLFNFQNHFMLVITLIVLFAVRIFLIFVADYAALLLFAIIVGACKGLLFVYWALVIPELSPKSDLTNSFGLLFIGTGICTYLATPILGSLFNAYEDSTTCAIFLNYLSLIVIVIFALGIYFKNR